MPDDTPAGEMPGEMPSDAPAPEQLDPQPAPEMGDGAKKALVAEREARREAERKLKEQAAELEQFRQATMTEHERAIAEATARARAEVLTEVGSRLVDAEVKAATAGRSVDVDAILEGLDRSRFLGDDGQPDAGAIASWVDRIAPLTAAPAPPPDLGQGARGIPQTKQLTRADLASMTSEQINEARAAGLLADLIAGKG